MAPPTASPPSLPLDGIRVLDLSVVVSGPFCTQILGDLGADVWKIEPPSGDMTRRLGPPFVGGLTPFFAQVNRNKRSLVIDLKTPEGVALVRRLARAADVMVENFRPGVLGRLGLSDEMFAADNPRLIRVAISGFGGDGPYAARPAYDMVIQALTGFAPIQGDETPRLVRSIVADKASGMWAANATLAALFARERNGGRGQRVEVPMLDAFAAFMLPDTLGPATFVGHERDVLPFSPADAYRAWPTKDGHVAIVMIEDHHFAALCRVLGRDEWIEDPRWSNLLQRVIRARTLFPMLGDEIAKWTTAELIERADRFSAPLAPVNDLTAFLADPQVMHNETIAQVDAGDLGMLRLIAPVARFDHERVPIRRAPPRLAEHTNEVLRERGLDDAEVAALRGCGAVR
jgi:crotonobetainyl-CoA:carnitine CoA-transferase CaiB-like acyl-CoA transferase